MQSITIAAFVCAGFAAMQDYRNGHEWHRNFDAWKEKAENPHSLNP
jgi:hypothetical protein